MVKENKLVIVKNRSDIGAGTRGSDMGIDAMEVAAINMGSDFFVRNAVVDVGTRNSAVYGGNLFPFARHIPQVLEQCRGVRDVVSGAVASGFPLVLSGDHSSAAGTIAGLRRVYPSARLGVVWIDAHADIHSPYTTPSGNMHGMPIAAVLGMDNLSCANNPVDGKTAGYWEEFKRLAGEGLGFILPEDVVYFGMRDTEPEEDEVMRLHSIRNFTVGEVRDSGVGSCVALALERLSGCELLYVSFDVDSMDCGSVSDGTGTPVPEGFSVMEIRALLDGLFASGKVCCLEVVEVNPLLDNKGNKMAETAFSIISDIFSATEKVR